MWTPLALAAQTATLAQQSGGRFVAGLGTGGYGPAFWESMGLPNKPIAIMRDWVTTVRALLRGETVTTDGPALRLRSVSLGTGELPARAGLPGRARPADRPASAGEVADGALLDWATPERIDATARR